MSRKDPRKRTFGTFAAHVEWLEDRRVMSADPLIEHQNASDPPPLEQTVQTGGLGEPDFWVDAEDTATFDDYYGQIEQQLVQAHNLTGWYNVQSSYGFTGRGQTVAVIDSGIAYNHFALGGGLGWNYRVVGGWDFTEENDANVNDDGPSGGHGTHVSGIIGGSGSPHTGVAPGVDFVGLRVFNDAGQGYFSWVENALKWVLQYRNAYENPITTINLSLGVSSWNAATIPQWANLEDEFQALEAAGIFIAVSAGNSFGNFNTPGLSYPASSQYVVPVMSVDDGGSLSYFSQRLPRAIAAPGRNIVSTVPDYKGNNNGVADDYATMSGTSMAAPYVAGAAVIIRQAMEFAGMTNITQDMIYNHMMANADTFYDSATNLSYKRLNLQKAVDALMPSDDYGSTTGTAHNLGLLNGSTNVSGAIGSKSDVDYFRFTAASTGTVTFNVTSSQQELVASWQAYGQNGNTLAIQNSNSLSFAVTAGQTYTVRIGSTGGVGRYAFSASSGGGSNGGANVQPSFTDWGAIEFSNFDDVVIGGERWLRVEAARTGILTVIAKNAVANGSNVAIYNSNMQLVGGGTTYGLTSRTDVQANAGAEYFIRITGNAADVDITVANLVSQSGTTVTVAGTSGDDVYGFAAGKTQYVTANGVQYQFAATAAMQFNFQGGAGNDSITLVGSSGNETANLYVGSSTLAGAAYAVSAVGFETQSVHGGGGTDVVNLYDSAGNDTFTGWSDRVVLAGANYSNEVKDFDMVKAFAANGGTDTATFFDSAGDDVFIAGYLRAVMVGGSYFNWAEGFDSTIAHATSGGYDRVEYYDSAGNDTLVAWPDRVTFVGQGFSHDARGFEQTKAFSISGGTDQATFYDSSGNDLYIAGYLRAVMVGSGFYHEAEGFDATTAHATAGGDDRVEFYDSAGNDVLTAWSDRATFVGTGFSHDARGFEKTTTFASGGYDVATFYDSAGDDVFTAKPTQVTMAGPGYSHEVRNFDMTKAIAASGGYDQAQFYDTAGNDSFIAGYLRAVLTGNGYWNEAEGFDKSIANATAGGYDSAEFFGSAGDDIYSAWSNRATLSGVGYLLEAINFDKTKSWSGGGDDQAFFYDSVGNDLFYAGMIRGVMTGTGYWNEAEGFKRTTANCTAGGNDKALLYGSAGNDSLIGSASSALLQGPAFRHEMTGFDSVVADMSGGGNDLVDVTATDYLFSLIGQ